MPNTIEYGIKLPPIVDEKVLNNYIDLIKNHPIKFVTCCNTIPFGSIFSNGRSLLNYNNGFGAIGGSPLQPIALAMTRVLSGRLNVPIITCGGISTGEDMYHAIQCGASAVQIGSAILRYSPRCLDYINIQIYYIMKQ